ncbi:MAG: VTT domain-containing protein [Oscillospiraceae bacterium]|nr:VTT domain-containing protein [Oscillospiraceae bacterium]
MHKTLKRIVQAAPFVMIAVMAAVYLTVFKDMSLEQLLRYTPAQPIAAAAVLLIMFALKSLSYFFPMALLFAACGVLFPPLAAIPLSAAGCAVMATIPFLIGRYAESDLCDRLAQKHKKIALIRETGTGSQFASAFFLRIISCLPYDIISMALGSMRYSYKKYLAGSVLGTLPGAVLTTLMGQSITDPFSAEFIICACLELVTVLVSAVIFRMKKRKKRVSNNNEPI